MMQQRWSSIAAFGLLLFVAAEAITFRSADQEEFDQAEGEDRSFWTQEWVSVERELKQLSDAAKATVGALQGTKYGHGVVVADLQLAAKPVTGDVQPKKETSKNATKTAAVSSGGKKNLVKEAKTAAAKKADDAVSSALAKAGLGGKLSTGKDDAVASALAKAGLGGGKLGSILGKEAALAPMLAMLKGLYQQGRERIGDLNKREKDQKEKFAKRVAQHQAKLDKIEKKFANHTLSAEFRTNETRDENRMFTYWQHCRDRQHKQYHNMLRIQHGTMEREKQMIDMYEKTLNGKTVQDKVKVAKQLSEMTGGGGGMPEVVFLQQAQSVVRFCQESLAEVSQDRAELNAAWKPEDHQTSSKRKSTSLLQRAKQRVVKEAANAILTRLHGDPDPAPEAAKVEAQNVDPDETEFDASSIQIPEDPRAQKPIDTSNGVVDSSVYDNNNDEVYDMTGQGFHILSRHQNTEEAIAERNLAEVNKISR